MSGLETPSESRRNAEYRWNGAYGPFSLQLAPGVFRPSSTSRVIGDALDVHPGDTVLDVGCGSGLLSFVAARAGAGRVVGCDVGAAAVACARDNSRRLGLDLVTEFRVGNLVEPARDVAADVLIADVSGVPDAVAAVTGWFPDGRGGGPTGAEVPIALLHQIGEQLSSTSRVYLPTGSIQDEEPVLAAARDVFGSRMEPVASREFALPDAVVAAPAVAELIANQVMRLGARGSRRTWRLTVWCCARG